MNIMQVQKALQSLDDNALKQEMLSPGMAPQFLVLTEMQRRQEIRKGGRPSTIPQSTMKDEAMGLGSLPEAPQGMPQEAPQEAPQGPPQGFAGGGPVGFAGGGQVIINGQTYDQDDPNRPLTFKEKITSGRWSPAPPQPPAPRPVANMPPVPSALGYQTTDTPQRGLSELSDAEIQQYLLGYSGGTRPFGQTGSVPTSSPYPQQDLKLELAARVPRDNQGPVERVLGVGRAPPITSNRQFAGTGEETAYVAPPRPPAGAGAADSPESLGYGAVPGQATPTPGLPGLRPTSGLGPDSLPLYPATRTASLIESGLGANTNHKGSTARGVLGITNGMWKDYADRLGLKDSDRDSPEASRRIYETFSDDQRKLNPKATDADVYTAWAAGPGAARAFRADPGGDAYTTYRGITNPGQADAAFSNNGALLRRGATNAQTLAAYQDVWNRAASPGGQPGPAFGGEGTGTRLEAPGSGAAALTGDSSRPAAVIDRGGDGSDFESYRARTRGVDRFGGFDEEAKTLFGDRAERTKQAGAFALLETGLGIMGSNSPRLAGAVSEGGLAGLKSYRVGLEEARRGEREGFSARLGIASARASQDQSNDRLAATVYGTDRQAETTLEAARIGANTQRGIATLQAGTQDTISRRQSQTQLDVAGIQAEAQRIAYGRNPQKDLAEWVLTFPEGPQREEAMRAAGRFDPSGYRDQVGMTNLQNSYNLEANRLRDDILGKQSDQMLLSPTEKAAKKREYEAAMRELQSRPHYQRLFQGGGAAPPPAAGALPDPLGLRG